jgi:hypothetical protein
MKLLRTVVTASIVLATTQGCAFQRAATADRAKTQMIGMSEQQVLACMGVPAGRQQIAGTDVWAYPSGGESNTTSEAFGQANTSGTVYGNSYNSNTTASAFGTSTTRNRYCVVNVVFQDGRVGAVNYSGRTGGLLTGDEQCAFAVQSCAQ